MNIEYFLETEQSILGDHLQLLESNELAVFSCQPLLQRMEANTTTGGQFSFLQDHTLRNRIETALQSSTRVRTLWWVLGWKEFRLQDGIAHFLATSTSLYDVTFVSPHAQLYISLASYLKAVANNPYGHIQRLEAQSAFLPIPTICQSLLRASSSCLRVLDLKGKAGVDDPAQLELSMDDLELFAQALAENTSLKELHLDWIHFVGGGPSSSWRPRHSKQKKQYPQNQSIASLAVCYCRFDSPLMAQRLMYTFGALERMRLSGNHGLDSWFYQLYKPCSSLTALQTENGPHPKAKWVANFLKRCNLHSYSLGWNIFEDDSEKWQADYVKFWKEVAKAIPNCVSLQELEIAVRCPFQPYTHNVISFFRGTQLTSLSISNLLYNFLLDLTSPQCKLKKLRLHKTRFDYQLQDLQYLNTVLCRNRSLKQVDLSWDSSPESVVNLSDRVIWAERFGDRSATPSTFVNNLQRFSITKSHVPPLFYEDLFQAMLSSLSSPSHLTELELGWMTWNDQTADLLCQYVRHPHCVLESLLLHGAGNGQTVNAIFEALTEYDRLRSFHITCQMADLKYAVAPHLPNLTCLQSLALSLESSGSIPDDILSEKAIQTDFLRALRSNKSLCYTSVEGFDSHQYWFPSHLHFYGMRNKVDTLFISGSPIPLGLWPILLEHLQQKEWCPSIAFTC